MPLFSAMKNRRIVKAVLLLVFGLWPVLCRGEALPRRSD
ncbi:MAG: hypothetical protein FD149_1206, partial [Rhodospirillaceae bacterium]